MTGKDFKDLLIKDDQIASPQVTGLAKRINDICRQQSPFVQSV